MQRTADKRRTRKARRTIGNNGFATVTFLEMRLVCFSLNAFQKTLRYTAPLHRRQAKQPGAPAAVLPGALCQGLFKAFTCLETRLVCSYPKISR